MRAYYFDCRSSVEIGHYFWDERKGKPFFWGSEPHYPLPWTPGEVDGRLCFQNGPQDEGLASLYHRDGWTAVAFWDRSADKRGGSNSVFFIEGTHDFAAAVNIARERFAWVWSRFTFDVVEASR